jgi:hypothetical protein
MTTKQWSVILALGSMVILIFCGLALLVVSDVYTMFEPLLALVRAELTPVPTVVYVPPAPPTATPPAARLSTTTADQAIALVQDYKYDPRQEQTIATLIATLLAASEQMGNDLSIKGWWAEDQGNDQWIVTFSFLENSSPTTYKFWADVVAGSVEGYNERANTLLTFLRQEVGALEGVTQPTPVVVPVGGAVRDSFTQWEYSVTAEPQWRPSIVGPDRELWNDAGFLLIPLRLTNVGLEPQTVDGNYYARFSLHDPEGRLAAYLGGEGFTQPTRLYCEAQGLPHFVTAARPIAPGESLDTALALALLPGVVGPLTLDVTTYQGEMLTTFSFQLGTPPHQ